MPGIWIGDAADHGLGPARLVGRGVPGHAREGVRRRRTTSSTTGASRAGRFEVYTLGDARHHPRLRPRRLLGRRATFASRSSRWKASSPSPPRRCPRPSSRLRCASGASRTRPTASASRSQPVVRARSIEWVDVDVVDRTVVREVSGQKRVPVAEIDGEIVVGSLAIVAAHRPDALAGRPGRARGGRGVPGVARPCLDAPARRRLRAHPRRRRRRRADRARGGAARRAPGPVRGAARRPRLPARRRAVDRGRRRVPVRQVRHRPHARRRLCDPRGDAAAALGRRPTATSPRGSSASGRSPARSATDTLRR